MARRDSYRTSRPRRGGLFGRDKDPVVDGEKGNENLIRYGAPWASPVIGYLLIEGTHLAVAGDPAASSFATLGVAAVGGGIAKLVSHLDRKAGRDKETKSLHLVNSAAMTVGSVVGTVVGLDTAATAGTWVLGGFALALGNNVFSLLHKQGKGEVKGKWAKLEAEIGLAKHELQEAKSNGKGTVIAKVEAKDGATAEEFARKIPAMAAAMKVGVGRITHHVNDDDVSDITMRVQVADLLKDGARWPGPSAFGSSFGDTPLPLGRYEDGEDLLLNIPGVLRDPKGLQNGNVEHCIAQGVNGAGKTVGNGILIAEAATRSEVSIIIIDCSKFEQDYGYIRHAADMVITDEKVAKRFFKQMGPTIKARSAYLAAKGLSKWEPGCGLNFLLIIGEEAADYAEGEAYGKVLRTLRAAGGWVETSIQRATHDQMDTTARSNHPAGMAYGLADGAEAAYVLPPEAIESGAFPGWGNRKPGYLYVAGMGIPQERWHVTARTYFSDRDVLAAAVTAGMNVRTPMDQTTYTALGGLWANRTYFTTPLLPSQDAVPANTEAAVEQVTDYDPALDVEDDDEVEVDEEMVARETAELDEELQALLEQDPEPGEHQDVTLEKEIAPPAETAPTLSLALGGDDGDKLPPEEARAAILQRLHDLYESGNPAFSPKDLADLWTQVALKTPRNWWNRLRTELLEAGVIEDSETYGEYDIVRDPRELDNGE